VNLIIVALFCWSVACMVFGAWGWPHAGNTARDLRRWVRGLGVRALGVEEPAAGVRALALEHTGEASHWWTLAEHHQRREEYADAIAAYHHALARAPEHPIILNNLAWLLCTAEDPLYRDPVQARELAQRAYKIKPSPFITDTLAEAIFQNGDPVRAVALEEEALAKNPPERPLYQKQLLKFRTAAQQVAARGPAGVSAETVNGSAQE
jgi:cytochrome c-type biogenesis protein CcmH/NrfG